MSFSRPIMKGVMGIPLFASSVTWFLNSSEIRLPQRLAWWNGLPGFDKSAEWMMAAIMKTLSISKMD